MRRGSVEVVVCVLFVCLLGDDGWMVVFVVGLYDRSEGSGPGSVRFSQVHRWIYPGVFDDVDVCIVLIE